MLHLRPLTYWALFQTCSHTFRVTVKFDLLHIPIRVQVLATEMGKELVVVAVVVVAVHCRAVVVDAARALVLALAFVVVVAVAVEQVLQVVEALHVVRW